MSPSLQEEDGSSIIPADDHDGERFGIRGACMPLQGQGQGWLGAWKVDERWVGITAFPAFGASNKYPVSIIDKSWWSRIWLVAWWMRYRWAVGGNDRCNVLGFVGGNFVTTGKFAAMINGKCNKNHIKSS